MKLTPRVYLIACALVVASSLGCDRKKSGAIDGTPVDPHGNVLVVGVAPNPADKGQVVTIDASASLGTYTGFVFNFGDGSPEVTQTSPMTTHVYDVINFQDTPYTISVKGYYGVGTFVNTERGILIKDLPPSIAGVDPGLDGKAIIGEWITLTGKNFLTIPVITVDGIAAAPVEIIDIDHLRFRVPPTARAGVRALTVTFPGNYPPYAGTLDVKRFALATSARFDKVYLLDVGPTEGIVNTGLSLTVTDASVVKISPDGSTAYVNNGRFQFLSTGTITVIDLTADGMPAIVKTMNVGNGPLYDMEVAPHKPVMVAGDSLGLSVFDLRNPADPLLTGYTSVLLGGDPVNDVLTVDLAVSDLGNKVVALSALSHEARIFNINGFNIVNPTAPVRITVGTKTQDAAISDDGNTLYVLGGGGEGAIPLDIGDPRAANITGIDLPSGTIKVAPYQLSNLNFTNPVAPIPFDLAISRSNSQKIFVTTLDQGFTTFFDKLTILFNDFTFQHLLDLIIFLQTDGLNLGKTVPVNFADTTGAQLMAPMQETLTAPTAADLLYNDHRMLQSSFRVWYDDVDGEFVFETGATVINLQAANASTYIPFTSEPISIDALFGLFQPPFSFGDVAFQP